MEPSYKSGFMRYPFTRTQKNIAFLILKSFISSIEKHLSVLAIFSFLHKRDCNLFQEIKYYITVNKNTPSIPRILSSFIFTKIKKIQLM